MTPPPAGTTTAQGEQATNGGGLPQVDLGRLLLVVAIGAVLWFIPPPEGVAPEAWHLFAIFVATVAGFIAKPLPMGAVAIIGITATVILRVLTVPQALSGFGNNVVWLVASAFFISRGFIKTGLGRRIGYLFMKTLGRSSLGLSYGLLATDLVLAPAMPSNTARAGGVILPIVQSVAKAFGSEPNGATARKLGAFLTKTAYQGNLITSAMFLTAMAANPLSVQLAGELGVELTWTRWALAALVPGAISLIVIPLLLFRLYPPEIRHTEGAPQLAREELAKMGPMKRAEKVLIVVFCMVLILWIFGIKLRVDATAGALAGLCMLLLTGVLTWKDVLREEDAWNAVVWFAALIMMASFLNTLGMTEWFSGAVGGWLEGTGWITAFLGLSLIYFYSHYFFASNAAHIGAMYAPFLAVALAAGAPPLLAALVLAYFSNLFSSMTHYATGPAPILFGSGYVEMGAWWRLGAIVSVVNIVIWLGVGGLWWKVLGLW